MVFSGSWRSYSCREPSLARRVTAARGAGVESEVPRGGWLNAAAFVANRVPRSQRPEYRTGQWSQGWRTATLRHGESCPAYSSYPRADCALGIHAHRQIQSNFTRSPPQLPPQITVTPFDFRKQWPKRTNEFENSDHRRPSPNSLPPSESSDSTNAATAPSATYPQATAIRTPARASRSDPSAVSNLNRALPERVPSPSAVLSPTELSARRTCEARFRSCRLIAATIGRASSII